MVLDANLELYNTAFDEQANGLAVVGSWVNLGRGGLPAGAQFIVGLKTGALPGTDTGTIEVELQLTLDNNTTRKTVAKHTFPLAGSTPFDGQQVMDVAKDFNPQEYAGANIDVRVNITPTGNAAANNATAAKLYAYLGSGEKQMFGRKTGSDTLAT